MLKEKLLNENTLKRPIKTFNKRYKDVQIKADRGANT